MFNLKHPLLITPLGSNRTCQILVFIIEYGDFFVFTPLKFKNLVYFCNSPAGLEKYLSYIKKRKVEEPEIQLKTLHTELWGLGYFFPLTMGKVCFLHGHLVVQSDGL